MKLKNRARMPLRLLLFEDYSYPYPLNTPLGAAMS